MSHLDELDEYEAELELQLRKEYSAVFGLFRYCVLTQDATYLCNKLDLQYVPQPAYPFFQLKMEDVWVWDKNRPTRIIPRAEVYTSSDVTIEELRGEGDEPKLTAETLAERIGESRRPTTSSNVRRDESLSGGVERREASLRCAEPVAELSSNAAICGQQQHLVLDVALLLASVSVSSSTRIGAPQLWARLVLGLWIPGEHVH